MKMLMKWLLCLSLLTGCVGVSPTVSIDYSLRGAYDVLTAYIEVMSSAYQRGRIDKEQAMKAQKQVEKAEVAIDSAATAVFNCKSPCDPQAILATLQPMLLEMERELREQQKKEKQL